MHHETDSLAESMRVKHFIMNRIPSFPPLLPTAFTQVARLTRDPEVPGSKIAALIEDEPFLSTNVLCLANALHFGLAQKVGIVKEAFSRLGGNKFLPLLFAASVAKVASESDRLYDLSAKELWEHLVGTAIGARKLSEALNLNPPEHLFLAALTHDIGKVVLGAIGEVEAEPVISLAMEEKIPFEQAEKRIHGIDHAEVGACLLEAWKLPGCLLDVVRYHHRPEDISGDPQVAYLVHIADAICMMGGVGASLDTLNYMPSPQAMSSLGIGTSFLENILYETLSELMQVSKR